MGVALNVIAVSAVVALSVLNVVVCTRSYVSG